MKLLVFLMVGIIALFCWPFALVALVLAPAACLGWMICKAASGLIGVIAGIVAAIVTGMFIAGTLLAFGLFALIF